MHTNVQWILLSRKGERHELKDHFRGAAREVVEALTVARMAARSSGDDGVIPVPLEKLSQYLTHDRCGCGMHFRFSYSPNAIRRAIRFLAENGIIRILPGGCRLERHADIRAISHHYDSRRCELQPNCAFCPSPADSMAA